MEEKTAKEHSKVRFEEYVTERSFTTHDNVSQEDMKRLLWLDRGDYSLYRDSAISASVNARKHGIPILLPGRFEGPYNEIQQHAFNEWCNSSLPVRGLERLCSQRHSIQRTRARLRATQSVLDAQKILNQGTRDEKTTEELARISMLLTEDAKQFAAMLGAADENAARDGKIDELFIPEELPVTESLTQKANPCGSLGQSEESSKGMELFPSAA